MSQLRQHEREIEARGMAVLAVTFEKQWLAEAYVRETQLPWPLLLDPSRNLYAAYGMAHGRWWDLFGPAAVASYGRLLIRGRRPQRPTGDVRQLGGDVLVDPAGIMRLHHVGRGPADRPEVEAILRITRTENE